MDIGQPQPEPRSGARIAPILWGVAGLALFVHVLAFSASQLWLYPDSRWYIELAVGIAERLDLADERFLIRTPGYPLMLASIFSIFGRTSPTAILVIQHAMVVAIAVVATLTGWYLTSSRSIALLAGILTACSLPLIGFANVVMTEVPYTLALVVSVCFLVKYHRFGGTWSLGLASLVGGLACLFRPVGMIIIAFCAMAALHRLWVEYRTAERRNLKMRQVAAVLSSAIAPAMLISLPFVIHNAVNGSGQQAGCTMGISLFHRVAHVERRDSEDSATWSEIRNVVEEAKQAGHLGASGSARRWWDVWCAYRNVRGESLAETSTAVTRAALDLAAEDWSQFAQDTITYAGRTLLMPDPTYRYQPRPDSVRAGVAAADDAILDISMFEPNVRRYMASEILEKYLPLHYDVAATTPLWTTIAVWAYDHIEAGPPIIGMGDSPYEEFAFLCAAGALLALGLRERWTWLLVSGIAFGQVIASALLAGTVPRYAIPVQPLLNLCAALLIVAVCRTLLRGVRAVVRRKGMPQVRGVKRRQDLCAPFASEIRIKRSLTTG